jgi:tetratricopeptide (TPR) repeat protein
MNRPGSARPFLLTAVLWLLAGLVSAPLCAEAQTTRSVLPPALEQARRTHDEAQLRSLETGLTKRMAENLRDPEIPYQLALVESWLLDLCERRNDKKGASAAVDKAIEAARKSIALKEESADAHSLLADLYGRKIAYGGMMAGMHFGPKITEENKRALALDDKNPRAWASLGRQYFFAPTMFGGDINKAVESLEKSLALDAQQDETWVWLAKAFQKQGDKPKARDAVQHALQLNPQSAFAKDTAASLAK